MSIKSPPGPHLNSCAILTRFPFEQLCDFIFSLCEVCEGTKGVSTAASFLRTQAIPTTHEMDRMGPLPITDFQACVTHAPEQVLPTLKQHGIVVLRDANVASYLQTEMLSAFKSEETFGSIDGLPRRPDWATVFNARDAAGKPTNGDGQRVQLAPQFASSFSQSQGVKTALRGLVFMLEGKSIISERREPTNTTHGISVPVGTKRFTVAANVLKGLDETRDMAQQPWHCDVERPGAYAGKDDFPYVVCFPLKAGERYRCNVVLPTQSYIGELIYDSTDVLFMRGDFIHSGSPNLFDPRVHLYIESSECPARRHNVTIIVDDEQLNSYYVDGQAPNENIPGSLHHFFLE